jgi:methylmalonyl-CoA mutase
MGRHEINPIETLLKHYIKFMEPNSRYDFEKPTESDWIEALKKSVKNPEDLQRLIWTTDDGFSLNAFPGDSIKLPNPGGIAQHLEIRQMVWPSKPQKSNALALKALNNGANALTCYADAFPTEQEWEQFLKGIHLDWLPVHYHFGESGSAAIWLLYDLLSRRAVKTEEIEGSIHLDPIGNAAFAGGFEYSEAEAMAVYTTSVNEGTKMFPNFHFVHADASIYREAGANPADELAFALATAMNYYDWLQKKGNNLNHFTSKTTFHFGTGGDYFIEIAKFRAFRILWKNILDKWGLDWQEPKVHVNVSNYNKTLYDAHNNLLRSVTECMAAVNGGASSFSVKPWNNLFDLYDADAHMLSRNLILILQNEAFIGKVPDPGKGAAYIEQATASIASKAWETLTEIEASGGMSHALKAGLIQQRCGLAAQQHKEQFNVGQKILVGINKYANTQEQLNGRIKQMIHPPYRKEPLQFVPLSTLRLAEALENKRLTLETQ